MDRIRLTDGFEMVNGSVEQWKKDTWLYPEVRQWRLTDLESFQCTITDELLLKYADKVGYTSVILGADKGLSVVQCLYEIVNNTNGIYREPIGLMIDSLQRVWALGADKAIVHILKYGIDIQVDWADFFIIDLQKKLLVDYRNVLKEENITSIEARIKNCITFQEYLDKGLRPMSVSYTIGDLMSKLTEYDLRGLQSYNYHYFKQSRRKK